MRITGVLINCTILNMDSEKSYVNPNPLSWVKTRDSVNSLGFFNYFENIQKIFVLSAFSFTFLNLLIFDLSQTHQSFSRSPSAGNTMR